MDYPFELVDDIVVWYHPKLQVQQGYQSIVIHMKRFLFHQWLTIEGAQGMAITREKGFDKEISCLMKEIFIEAAYLLWTIYYNFVILFIGATKTVGGYPSSEGAIPSTQIRNPFGNQSKGG